MEELRARKKARYLSQGIQTEKLKPEKEKSRAEKEKLRARKIARDPHQRNANNTEKK